MTTVDPGPELVRDMAREERDVFAFLRAAEPRLEEAVEELRREPPVPPTTEAFVAEPCYRPPGSSRSFYCRPWAADAPPRNAVLAIKGMEPVSPTFPGALQDLLRPSYSAHNIAEHFVLEERKIPGCLTLEEALKEAERAAAVQVAHVRAYGHLARLPVPLLVFRHTKATVSRVTESLRDVLSDAAQELVEQQMSGGLGAYVYYYPAVPVRVTHLEHLLRGLSFPKRTLALLTMCDPELVVRRWVTTVVRMLYLGYLAGSLSSRHTGICCQPQNACVDGGFVDLDSVTPIAALRDDTAVHAALQFVTEELTRTVRHLMSGGIDDPRPDEDRFRADRHHLRQYVLGLIQEAIRTERRPGLDLDARVAEYFEPAQSVEALVTRLSSCFPGPGRVAARAWQDFDRFGRAWIEGVRDDHPGYGSPTPARSCDGIQ